MMTFKRFSDLIMFEKSPFILPWVYVGILFAGEGVWTDWFWAGVAAVSARAVGMAFNQVIDAQVDGLNPRTRERLIPSGVISARSVWLLAGLGSLMLIGSAYMLNDLCFYLSFAAVFMLFTYTYVKRFSATYHFGLGLVQAASPIGGYLAVTGEFTLIPFILGFAVMMWVAGFDIIYALLDMDFDRSQGYHSVPASLGWDGALLVSACCFVLAIGALVWAGLRANMAFPYWIGLIGLAGIFIYEQRLARSVPLGPVVAGLFRAHVVFSTTLIFTATLAAEAL